MTQQPLIVTLAGSTTHPQEGASLDDVLRVLRAVSRAMRLMVGYLGGWEGGTGQPPKWVRDQALLQIAPLEAGSLAFELTCLPAHGTGKHMDDLGPQALEALRNWDGTEESTLPERVTACLHEAASGLRDNARLYLGNRGNHRMVEVRRKKKESSGPSGDEVALVSGWLREVNWHKGTAQLHDSSGGHVRLRFGAELGGEMLRCATQFVEVRGTGQFNDQDEWKSVEVSELSAPDGLDDPFDLDAFLSDPDAKIFDSGKLVKIELTEEEGEAFDRAIREGRRE